MPVDLAELLLAAAGGREDAFAALVQRHLGLVWSIIRSFRLSRSDGEDAAQGVWLALVQHLGSIRDAERLPSWIATTTRRECIAVLRRSARGPGSVDLSAVNEIAAAENDPSARMISTERARAVAEAMRDLDDRCRQLLVLLGSEPPLSYADVAEMFGVPVGAIGPTRQRCLEKLRRHRAILRLKAS